MMNEGSALGVSRFADGGTRHGGGLDVTDELVQERATQATDNRAGDVDPQLAQMALRADERSEDVRPDLAGGVESSTGDRADEDDDPVDDEPDDDPGKARRGTAVDGGAEDRE